MLLLKQFCVSLYKFFLGSPLTNVTLAILECLVDPQESWSPVYCAVVL
jgi:hypothetical protein